MVGYQRAAVRDWSDNGKAGPLCQHRYNSSGYPHKSDISGAGCKTNSAGVRNNARFIALRGFLERGKTIMAI